MRAEALRPNSGFSGAGHEKPSEIDAKIFDGLTATLVQKLLVYGSRSEAYEGEAYSFADNKISASMVIDENQDASITFILEQEDNKKHCIVYNEADFSARLLEIDGAKNVAIFDTGKRNLFQMSADEVVQTNRKLAGFSSRISGRK